MESTGYRKQRFPNLQSQFFDCFICKQVVKGPKQCSNCGNLYCSQCISNYLKTSKLCPNSCQVTSNSIVNMSARAMVNIYNDLDIRCTKCTKVLKMSGIQKHEQQCGKPKCPFFQFCSDYQRGQIKPYCSEKCELLGKIIECKANEKQVYEILSKFVPKIPPLPKNEDKVSNGGSINLKWNKKQCGMYIQNSSDGYGVFLKQQAYVFRTVLTEQPFYGGKHYWEIIADPKTENQLKIGVSGSNSFDYNTAFCDHKFGFAYYGLGQLRHGSNATGPQYGKRFKKTGVLGVYLNMQKGSLSFSLNGEDLGQAYNDADLKKGPLYPAVALLHCSGCIIKGELPIPQLYQGK